MLRETIINVFFYLVVIITFSSFALCIQNGEEEPHTPERSHQTSSKFFPENRKLSVIETPSDYMQSPPRGNAEDKFVFPNEYQNNVDSKPNELPNNYANRVTSRQRANPYDSSFNTGEYYVSPNGGHNKRPISNYPNRLLESSGYGGDVPNYQANDNPNYFESNYAQDYNHPGNKRPNYNRRPMPPLRPPRYDYPYQSQRERPYPVDDRPSQAQYDYPSYAGLFNNFQSFSNPLSGLFSNFGGQPSNPIGNRLNKALADISANDELNCVPKLLCQMIGNPERRAELPSFLSAPAINSLVAALPSTSPALVFGRAALLGFTGGEDSCDTSYSKCPSNEDDLLYYLNNHRGGFFRFFNGGESFSDVSGNFYNPHSQYGGNNQQLDSGSNQGGLESGAANLGGLNLGSLGSNLGLLGNLASLLMPTSQNSDAPSGGLGSIVGNLLTGLVGGRSKSRKLSKRSLEGNETIVDEFIPKSNSSLSEGSKEIIEKLKENLEDAENEVTNGEQVEGRIINSKSQIFSDLYNDERRKVKFPFDNDNYVDSSRYGKRVKFEESIYQSSDDREPPTRYRNDDEPYRTGKKIRFKEEFNQNSYNSQPSQDYRYPDDNTPHRTKMIFPDRTGTGNLRFDNSDFEFDRNRDRDRDSYPTRYGKILNRPSYSSNSNRYENNNYDDYYPTRRPAYYPEYDRNDYSTTRRPYYPNYNRYDYTTTRRPYYQNYDRYESTTRRPSYSNDYYGTYQANRYTTSRPQGGEGNVYVTNAKGVVEYYIKPGGQKVYL